MKLAKRADGWWIVDIPDTMDCGPYSCRAEANEDKAGMERTLEHWEDHRFWTTSK